jgi:hypothetical protein
LTFAVRRVRQRASAKMLRRGIKILRSMTRHQVDDGIAYAYDSRD